MSNGDSDKRRFKRAEAKFSVTCRVDKLADTQEARMWVGSREVDTLMMDMSEGGIAIITEENIPVSTIISVNFTLVNFGPEGGLKPMEITGEVRSNTLVGDDEHRLGIRFVRVSEEDKAAIAEFVKSK